MVCRIRSRTAFGRGPSLKALITGDSADGGDGADLREEGSCPAASHGPKVVGNFEVPLGVSKGKSVH